MVLKKRKPGASRLNTGRTIRCSPHQESRRRYAFVTYTKEGSVDVALKGEGRLRDVLAVLPSVDVEYSLNKKGRWQVADMIHRHALPQVQDADYEVTLNEHHHRMGCKDPCTGVLCDQANGKEALSAHCLYSGAPWERPVKARKREDKKCLEVIEDNEDIWRPAGHLFFNLVHSTRQDSSAAYIKQPRVMKQRRRPNESHVGKRSVLAEALSDYYDKYYDEDNEDGTEMSLSDELFTSAVEQPVMCALEDILETRSEAQKTARQRPSCHWRTRGVAPEEETKQRKKILHVQCLPSDAGPKKRNDPSTFIHEDPISSSVTVVLRDAKEVSELFADGTHGKWQVLHVQPPAYAVDLSEKLRRLAEHHHGSRQKDVKRLTMYLVANQFADCSREYCFRLMTNLRMNTIRIETLLENGEYSLGEVLGKVEQFLTMIPIESFSPDFIMQRSNLRGKPPVSFTALKKARGWAVSCETVHELGKRILDEPVQCLDANSSKDVVVACSSSSCEICCCAYGANELLVSLEGCSHRFCVCCWRAHLLQEVTHGSCSLQCPGIGCREKVSPAVAFSFVGPTLYLHYVKKLAESRTRQQGIAKWCLSPYCERLLGCPAVKGGKEPVCSECACGNTMCFECTEGPHWPLPCHQAKEYHAFLEGKGMLQIRDRSIDDVVVHTKPCPSCKGPTMKTELCPRAYCQFCDIYYCWKCMSSEQGFHSCATVVEEQKVLLWHLPQRGSSASGMLNSATPHRLYKNDAIRKELLRKALAFAKRCKADAFVDFARAARDRESRIDKLESSVTRYVTAVVTFKLEAHHIIEYSLVCLGTHTGATEHVDDHQGQLRHRAAHAVSKLTFALERLDQLLVVDASIGAADIRRLDDVLRFSRQCTEGLVKIMAATQGF